jgi:DNA (cytosine-5)-methyltransferase 1
MARLGLGPSWRCLLANDIDPAKCAAYRDNFGGDELIEADLASLTIRDLPRERADLAWASFPCQDLSLAGARAGLSGARSGLFFPFLSLVEALASKSRAPRVVAVENVAGLMTSRGGADFAAVAEGLASAGYRVSALLLNAKDFTPQSRPRLFIFGFGDCDAPAFAARPAADEYTPHALLNAVGRLPARSAKAWRWLAARPSRRRNSALADVIDLEAADWRDDLGAHALALMSARQRAAVDELMRAGGRHVGAAFRRIRIENGARVQRLEARFDGLAGCLRTPAGGSSRQMLLLLDGARVRARLLNPREAARLMGLPEDYRLPTRATAALHLCGDGVAAPVVRWIAEAILEPAFSAKAAA